MQLILKFEYHFACRRKGVHLCSIMSYWQNDICSFRATNVALTLSFKLISFNIYCRHIFVPIALGKLPCYLLGRILVLATAFPYPS